MWWCEHYVPAGALCHHVQHTISKKIHICFPMLITSLFKAVKKSSKSDFNCALRASIVARFGGLWVTERGTGDGTRFFPWVFFLTETRAGLHQSNSFCSTCDSRQWPWLLYSSAMTSDVSLLHHLLLTSCSRLYTHGPVLAATSSDCMHMTWLASCGCLHSP